jgi:hypothetical protein
MHLRTRTIRGLLAFTFVLLIAAAGCPTLKLGEVTVKPGSTSATRFTLQSTIVVEETEETEGEDQSRQSGKGLLGMHLPDGWRVAAARMRSPTESTDRTLWAAPQAAGAYAEAFPHTGGVWWAFSSATQEIPKGLHTYQLEVDVVVPKKTKAGSLGVSVTVLSDDLKDLPAPVLYNAAIKGKSVTIAKKAPAGLSAPPPAQEGAGGKAPSGG